MANLIPPTPKHMDKAERRIRREDVSFELASVLLKYEPESGKLFWLPRPVCMFNSTRSAKIWNTRYAGEEAFTSLNNFGYLHGSINNRLYLAHRIIWLLHYGVWPVDQVDHINGIRTDNSIENLRSVSVAENARNVKLRVDNSSGVPGVLWRKKYSRWAAFISIDNRTHWLGSFGTLEDAVAARHAAEKTLGFHPNHGRVA